MKISGQLAPVEALQVLDADLHPASLPLARVVGAVAADVELVPALAGREAGEEVHGLPSGPPRRPGVLLEDAGALVPQLLADDGLDRHLDPLGTALRLDLLPVRREPGVVRYPDPLGGRVLQQAQDRRLRERRPRPGPVAGLVEDRRDRAQASVLGEELVHPAAHGSLVGVGDQLLALPPVAEGRLAPERLAEHGADGDGGRDAVGDLLALPLSHRGEQGVEEAPGRRRGVDCLLEADQSRVVLLERVRELQQLLRVAGEAGELREDQRLDPSLAQVVEHPPRLGMVLHRLAADRLEPVGLGDHPVT